MIQSTQTSDLYEKILNQIDSLIADCESNNKPLEVDPARGKLFELFALAEGAGLVGEDADPDLSADGICAKLSERWGLQAAAQASVVNQSKLPESQLVKMRSLWSVMRMWMEWTYAWQRWPEFRGNSASSSESAPD